MHRLFTLVLLAVAASALPASAYVYSNCQAGDWRAVDVVAANQGVVAVCTRKSPSDTVCTLVESICNPV
jgi:hypothetical protein